MELDFGKMWHEIGCRIPLEGEDTSIVIHDFFRQSSIKKLDALRSLTAINYQIRQSPNYASWYAFRSEIYRRLEDYEESVKDAEKCFALGGNDYAYYPLGVSLYCLGRLSESYKALRTAKDKEAFTAEWPNYAAQWFDWCGSKIKKFGISVEEEDKENVDPIPQGNHSKDRKSLGLESSLAAIAIEDEMAENVMPVPKIRHDWYQTDTSVVITILVKNLKYEDVKIDILETSVSVTARLPSGSDYCLELDLCHPIRPEQSTYKVFSSKVEIKLTKIDGIMWGTLEGDGFAPVHKPINSVTVVAEQKPSYPTSSQKKKDWNKIEAEVKKDEENEKLEGDQALNQLFQKIYSEGSEEVRRAMNKSFSESGGTVLSTNWKEVGTDKVDIKPPDGMEWKNWEK